MFNVVVMGNGWAAEMHIRAFQKLADVKVVAVCGHNDVNTAKVASKYAIPNIYTDHIKMLREQKADIAAVCTPNYLHRAMSIDAMRAGADVLCEKPAAINSDELDSMISIRNATGKKLIIAHQKRFTSEAKYLKSIITRGVLGEVYNVNSQWVRCQGIPGMGGWFTNKAKSGGGALIDIGVHVLDLSMWFLDFPEPKTICGICGSRFGHNGLGAGDFGSRVFGESFVYDVEDYASAQIITKNGISIQLQCAWAAHVKEERFNVELWGDKCGASLCPPEIYSSSKSYTAADIPSISLVNEYDLQVADFVNYCISGEPKELCTAEQALAVMNIIEAVYL
jgi:predicted dehydrogenase